MSGNPKLAGTTVGLTPLETSYPGNGRRTKKLSAIFRESADE